MATTPEQQHPVPESSTSNDFRKYDAPLRQEEFFAATNGVPEDFLASTPQEPTRAMRFLFRLRNALIDASPELSRALRQVREDNPELCNEVLAPSPRPERIYLLYTLLHSYGAKNSDLFGLN